MHEIRSNRLIFTVCNEVAKVMFLHLSVCPRGVCLSAGWDTTPAQEQASLRAGTPHPGADTPPLDHALPPPPPSRRLRLRMVRILLECILVSLVHFMHTWIYVYSKFQLVKSNQICWVAISFIELPYWFKDYFALISGRGGNFFHSICQNIISRETRFNPQGAIELNVGKFK